MKIIEAEWEERSGTKSKAALEDGNWLYFLDKDYPHDQRMVHRHRKGSEETYCGIEPVMLHYNHRAHKSQVETKCTMCGKYVPAKIRAMFKKGEDMLKLSEI